MKLDIRKNRVVSVFPGGKAVQLTYRASKTKEILTQKNKVQEIQAQTNKVQETVLQGFLPVFGEITSGYGPRIHPITKQYEIHQGIDIAAAEGTVVRAVAAGTAETGQLAGFGNYVIIKHNSTFETLYGHLDKIYTPSGTVVAAGEAIGTVGSTGLSTGPHLHFEVMVNHRAVDPLPFLELLEGGGGQ